jgi:CubicO group peptidase (beta-lactamase class C family)
MQAIFLLLFCFNSLIESASASEPTTDALLIMKNGKLVFEQYQNGYDATKKHILWSVSKSVTSLLYAAAEQNGKLSRLDSVCKYIDIPNKEMCSIQMLHLLQFSSGIKWKEEYENTKEAGRASILAMLYGEGKNHMPQFVWQQPLESKPGSVWLYSSGDTMLLTHALENAYTPQSIYSALKSDLFNPLGISEFTLEADGSGHAAGAYFFYLRAQDLLKLGELLLNKGVWNKKQILPANWLDFILQVPPAYFLQRPNHDELNVGGGHFWLNKIEGTGMTEAPWPGLPQDAFMALGHWGQYLLVIPSKNITAVRFGNARDKSYTSKSFSKFVEGFL